MDVREFKVTYHYRTHEVADTTVIATSKEHAQAIAEYAFRKQYTAKCVLDRIEIK